ncbi:OmpA family protein [Bacterioplanoides sp. SCSIO 12839]|uniref:OmpA family protein n=1 Tax=Bacterioplanoides sp. SCSIO 12839 TaxID=2829569 RepID=UPI002104BC1C|nr:OmpA family protein [Bacterioplanoides sp. SCSIO 12839]UTW47178.1 OmpA family protein [Bacterioplanoides sp. SCSIO 12839]
MIRVVLFLISFGASVSVFGSVNDVDNDGLCRDNQSRVGECIAGPDTDDSNPDVNGDGICDGIRSVIRSSNFIGCMRGVHAGQDSDGDGINDELEVTDTDGDNIPDYIDPDDDGSGAGDSDADGIDDLAECGRSLPCLDSDSDGTFDYLDQDSDNDGLVDDLEADHIAGNGSGAIVTALNIDGDAQEDFRDTDSDNDGRLDEIERPVSSDQDSDGIPDVYDFDDRSSLQGGGDSDNDGLSDAQECPVYPACPDSDLPADGRPDYLDSRLDTDDDGIPDNIEDPNFDQDNNPATQVLDTDQDGDADYRDADSDGDGLLDENERNNPFDASQRLDTDRDGIPDVVDFDGRLNANGAGGDSDSDGVADAVECPDWPLCPDTDGDGIFDYVDGDSSPPPPPQLELGEVSTANDGVGALWWLLLLFPLLVVTRAQATEAQEPEAGNEAFALTQSGGFDWYLSAGFGRSQLEPDTSGSLYSVDRKGDWAYRVAGGWDINHFWSLEAAYADLGRARLSPDIGSAPDGYLSYQSLAASVVGNYWILGGERLPWSLSLVGRLGFGTLMNQGDDVEFEQQTSIQLITGAGLEWYLPGNYSTALQIDAFDTDAMMLSLSLTKRFGQQQALVYALPAVEPEIVPVRRAMIVPLVVDSDSDGVLDDKDACLSTPVSDGVRVDESGCVFFQGVIGGIDFVSSSHELTGNARKVVQELAEPLHTQMKNFEKLRLQVRVHTDSRGSDHYNRQLSQQRAESVVRELLNMQIEAERLSALGMGEREPVADNRTVEGRDKNRRVEFILTGIVN